MEISSHLEIEGLGGPVRTLVDRWGIPHIYASQREDAAFALGWIHARDRLAQMDLDRRTALGQRAELLGADELPSDRLAHLLDLPRSAGRGWEAVSRDSIEARIIEAYTAGVNHHLGGLEPADYPPYYLDSGMRPRPWTPSDCFAVYLTWCLRHTFSVSDLGRELRRHHFADRLEEIEPPALLPPELHPVSRTPSFPFAWSVQLDPGEDPARGERARELASRALETELGRHLIEMTGTEGRFLLALGARTRPEPGTMLYLREEGESGLLGQAYGAHLISPLMGVSGWTLPGVPAILVGHNEELAWAINEAGVDTVDFFVEDLEVVDADAGIYRTRHGDRKEAVETRLVRIGVRGEKAVSFTIHRTRHGPLWPTESGPLPLSLGWTTTGTTPGPGFVAFLGLSVARDPGEFRDALRRHRAPALGFLVASRRGEIHCRLGGRIPLRAGPISRYLLDGTDPGQEWHGIIPFAELPAQEQFDEGFTVLAGQTFLDPRAGYPYYLGRGRPLSPELESLLLEVSGDGRRTPASLDARFDRREDPILQVLVRHLVEAHRDEIPADPETALSLRMLEGWNGALEDHRVEPTLATRWRAHFEERLWGDDWDETHLRGKVPFPTPRSLLHLLEHHPESDWFDDSRTETVEDRDLLIRQSFQSTVEELRERHGLPIALWRWHRHRELPEHTRRLSRRTHVDLDDLSRTEIEVEVEEVRRLRLDSGLPPVQQSWVRREEIPLRHTPYLGSFPGDEISEVLTFQPPYVEKPRS